MVKTAYLIGVGLYLAGSIVVNFGINLMKFSHLRNDAKPEEQRKSAVHQHIWQFGLLLFCVGNLVNFAAFGFAAQSLLAAVGSVQFISNLFFATLVLGEKITLRVCLATAAIVVGNVIIVIYASHETQKFSSALLISLYTRAAFLIYVMLLLASVVSVHFCYLLVKKMVNDGIVPESSSWNLKFLPTAYAAVSAMFGSISVMLGKSCSELLNTTLTGDNQLKYFFTYVVLGVFFAVNTFWIIRMNSALKKYSAIFIVPALQVIWMLFSILGGGIYFREFTEFRAINYVMFVFGVMILITGVYFLAPRQQQQNKEPVDLDLNEDEDGETIDPKVVELGVTVVVDGAKGGEFEEISLQDQTLEMEMKESHKHAYLRARKDDRRPRSTSRSKSPMRSPRDGEGDSPFLTKVGRAMVGYGSTALPVVPFIQSEVDLEENSTQDIMNIPRASQYSAASPSSSPRDPTSSINFPSAGHDSASSFEPKEMQEEETGDTNNNININLDVSTDSLLPNASAPLSESDPPSETNENSPLSDHTGDLPDFSEGSDDDPSL